MTRTIKLIEDYHVHLTNNDNVLVVDIETFDLQIHIGQSITISSDEPKGVFMRQMAYKRVLVDMVKDKKEQRKSTWKGWVYA